MTVNEKIEKAAEKYATDKCKNVYSPEWKKLKQTFIEGSKYFRSHIEKGVIKLFDEINKLQNQYSRIEREINFLNKQMYKFFEEKD